MYKFVLENYWSIDFYINLNFKIRGDFKLHNDSVDSMRYSFVLYKNTKGEYCCAKDLEDYRKKFIKELDDLSLELECRSKDIADRTRQLMKDAYELYHEIQNIKRRYK